MDFSVSAADVRINSMNATARRLKGGRVEVTTTIEIYSDNDDDAQNVRCIVALPPTSRVASTSPPAVVGPTYPALGPASQFIQSEATTGYVLFDLQGSMGVGESRTLELVTRVHESWAQSPIAAFVSSDVPDPDPSNNNASVQATLP